MDSVVLKEISLNERVVTHPQFGKFIVRRPTPRVEADIETARTRQLNRDLQCREVVDGREVPAFFTRQSKIEQLRFHGLWTIEQELALEKAIEKYREACIKLDDAGYDGLQPMATQLSEIRQKLEALLGAKINKLKNELDIICPDPENFNPETVNQYAESREKIRKAAKHVDVDELLDELDPLHKLANFYHQGIVAQSELVALRISEFSLFTDTLESRADKAAQFAKVFRCTFTAAKKPAWLSMEELECDDISKITWLVGEIEKLERVEPGDTEEDVRRRDRFNFLAQVVVKSEPSGESQDPPKSNPGGDSAEEELSISTAA